MVPVFYWEISSVSCFKLLVILKEARVTPTDFQPTRDHSTCIPFLTFHNIYKSTSELGWFRIGFWNPARWRRWRGGSILQQGNGLVSSGATFHIFSSAKLTLRYIRSTVICTTYTALWSCSEWAVSHTGENSLRGGEGGGQGAREESEKEGEGGRVGEIRPFCLNPCPMASSWPDNFLRHISANIMKRGLSLKKLLSFATTTAGR